MKKELKMERIQLNVCERKRSFKHSQEVCDFSWKEVKDLGLFDKTTHEEKGENHDLQQFTQPCLILGNQNEQK